MSAAHPTANSPSPRPLHVWCTLATLVIVALALPSPAHAAEVRVAVAANFSAPLTTLADRFHTQTGHTIAISPGSTGKLATQIRQGAPFDVFLAADDATPSALEKDGLTVPGSRFVYAIGRLVLWSPDPTLVDPQGAVLRTGKFHKLALADPLLAPYGLAAQTTLTRMALWTTLAPKIVRGDNVQQAYQFAASGNAQLAFLALSQVTEHGRVPRGSVWVVPASLHAPIAQAAVQLKTARDPVASAAFLTFLKSPDALDLLRQAGYEPPAGP